jgi:hypothetical protein
MSKIELIKKFEDFKNQILQLKNEFEKETNSKLLLLSTPESWDITIVYNVNSLKTS